MKNNIGLIIVGVILLGCIIWLGKVSTNNGDDARALQLLLDSTNSELVITKNKLGQEQATIQNITTQNINLILDLDTKDQSVILLQQEIQAYKKSKKDLQATIVSQNETIANYQSSTTNTVIGTTSDDSTSAEYQIYERKIDMFGKWITGNIVLGLDTTNIHIKTMDDYVSSIYRERKNMFSSYNYYTTITNLNPYTSTTSIKSYSKLPVKERNMGLSIFAGEVYIDGRFIFTIGAGITYTFIKF